MAYENECAMVDVEDVAIELHRISSLCDMMNGWADSPLNIPKESLSDTLNLIRDLLDNQIERLYSIQLPQKTEARSA